MGLLPDQLLQLQDGAGSVQVLERGQKVTSALHKVSFSNQLYLKGELFPGPFDDQAKGGVDVIAGHGHGVPTHSSGWFCKPLTLSGTFVVRQNSFLTIQIMLVVLLKDSKFGSILMFKKSKPQSILW